MDLKLDEKVAVVTGGASGIGEAVVRCLAQENACVVIVDKDQHRSELLAESFDNVHALIADLTNHAQCQDTVHQIIDTWSGIDVLVNNAGLNDGVDLNAGVAAFEQSLQKNLMHVYEMTHCCVDSLKQRHGAIVNVGSKVATTGQGGTSGYAASKGAMNALTREWAVELAADRVRVNCVIPAEVWTPLYARCLENMPNPQQARQNIERLIPLEGRFTTAEEIADTIVFLCSIRSAHTTGQIVFVDGGYSHLDRKCSHADIADFGAAF